MFEKHNTNPHSGYCSIKLLKVLHCYGLDASPMQATLSSLSVYHSTMGGAAS